MTENGLDHLMCCVLSFWAHRTRMSWKPFTFFELMTLSTSKRNRREKRLASYSQRQHKWCTQFSILNNNKNKKQKTKDMEQLAKWSQNSSVWRLYLAFVQSYLSIRKRKKENKKTKTAQCSKEVLDSHSLTILGMLISGIRLLHSMCLKIVSEWPTTDQI